MKQKVLGISVLFALLTIAGSLYVMISGGSASAVFAVLPMVLMLACLVGSRFCRSDGENQ